MDESGETAMWRSFSPLQESKWESGFTVVLVTIMLQKLIEVKVVKADLHILIWDQGKESKGNGHVLGLDVWIGMMSTLNQEDQRSEEEILGERNVFLCFTLHFQLLR